MDWVIEEIDTNISKGNSKHISGEITQIFCDQGIGHFSWNSWNSKDAIELENQNKITLKLKVS